MRKANKVALVGLDGIIPEFAEKFMAEGAMPNLKKLKREGFYAESIPSLPAWTPGNWASIVTGAQTSTHGHEGFEVHLPGEPLPFEVYHRGFDSSLRKAETFWEAAAGQGRKTILLKFPGTWPILLKEGEGIQIAGAAGFGGLRSYLDVWHGHCFSNDPEIMRATPIYPKPAKGWQRIPVPEAEALECELNIKLNQHRGTLTFHGLIYRSGSGNGYDRFLVCRSKDGSQPLGTVQPGQWSDWIVGAFGQAGELEAGGFRFKLVDMAPDASRIKLFMTQNHPLTGFTFPDHIAQEISEIAGPFPEHTSLWPFHLGWIDHETWMELIEQHTDWLIKVAQHALAEYEWDIFVTQHHPIDYVEHMYMGAVVPSHPDYKEEDVELGWEGLRRTYQCADKFLGAVMDAVGEDVLVVMTGDHGTEVLNYLFWPNNVFEQAGLLVVKMNEKGEYEPVWSETRVYAHGPNFVYINLRGRDPEGIVEPGEEYEELREQVIQLLKSAKCEQTGIYPVSMAIKREEADYFGLYGDGVGDVIYTLEPGFDNGQAERSGKARYRAGVTESREICTPTKQWRDLTGDHSAIHPFSKRNRTLTVFCGPGVRTNVKRRTPIRLIDVAPTISYLIGTPYAAQTEGSVILDALQENDAIG